MVLFGQLLPLKICVLRPMTLSVFIDLHRVVGFFAYFQHVTYNLNERFRATSYRCAFASLPSVFLSGIPRQGFILLPCSFFFFFNLMSSDFTWGEGGNCLPCVDLPDFNLLNLRN